MDYQQGERCGGYVLLQDGDTGQLVAIRPTAIAAALSTDGRTVLLLPGGRVVIVDASISVVLGWLSP